MKYPQAIQNLINTFSKLPSVGPKTAERYVFYLLKQNPEELQKFAQSIAELKEKIIICQSCNAVADYSPCSICQDVKRDKTSICVVANTRDMLTIDAIKQFNGIYFILGGLLNPIEGVDAKNLNINQLLTKISQTKAKEIIFALNPNFEGEATIMYISKLIKPMKIKTSRLAKGLPMGADLEYADEITLANSLKYRNEI
jgi:recombination protein RecR